MGTKSDQIEAPSVIPSLDDMLSCIEPIDYVNGTYISSPSTEWEAIRLFGYSELDVRVVLYRDHASWCPYCHKVQLLLEYKRIPYVVRKENMNSYGKKSEDFLRRNPSGLLPVILLDGELRTESTPIMFLLEEEFPVPVYTRTIPTNDNDRMQAFHRYTRLERVLTGVWLTALRCPVWQYKLARGPLIDGLDMVDRSLYEFAGPYFLGEEPTFVDIVFAPILMRMSSTLKYFRNLDICEGRENLTAWFQAMQTWEASRRLMSDDISYALSIPPQIGTVNFLNERTEVSTNVDNERARHILSEEDIHKPHRLEAADRFCTNYDAVYKDACRGANVMDVAKPAVDLAFRAVAAVLLNPSTSDEVADTAKCDIVEDDRASVVAALKFMRSRCCTPRDMTIDALVQFCGAINWSITTLGDHP